MTPTASQSPNTAALVGIRPRGNDGGELMGRLPSLKLLTKQVLLLLLLLLLLLHDLRVGAAVRT